MKNLGIFYLICVVLLSVMPCSDELEAREFVQTSIVKVAHCQQETSAESCSPICLCVCCGQSVVAPVAIIFEWKVITIALNNHSIGYQFKPQQRTHNIWQPPKLV